jgi:hypothetical protein
MDSANSFGRVLEPLRRVFTKPTFETFRVLVLGMVCQVGECTVTGMLTAAGMSTRWHHTRAHRFFSRASWQLDELGLGVMSLVIQAMLEPGEAVRVVIDDTLFRRSGRKVAHAFWQHDGAADAPGKLGFGNNFVVLGIIVRLPFMTRAVCLPVLFRLHTKGGPPRSELANRLVWIVSTFVGDRRVEVVADGAYACEKFAQLPERATFISRLRANAALHRLTPPRTGKKGRPRTKGERLPALAEIATDRRRRWRDVTVTRYGRSETIQVMTLVCLWYTVFKQRPVRVVLVREPGSTKAFDFAMVATDNELSAAQVVERYAERWSIEVAFRDAKQITGVGEARNRTALAVERTVPFGLLVQSLVTIWYTHAGHTGAVVAARRRLAPWYDQKREPSWLDMLTTLRRQLIADHFRATPHPAVTHTEILDPAWALELLAS